MRKSVVIKGNIIRFIVFVMSWLFLECLTPATAGTIVRVESINIQSPIGTVPRLPYLVWVEYADGKAEYRQTKWTNAAPGIEQAQADPALHPVGHE